MCENCEEIREKMIQEISELAREEGEIYDALVKVCDDEEIEDEDERKALLDTNVAKAIMIRAAFALVNVTDGEFHQTAPSIALGIVAGECLNIEIERDAIRHAAAEVFKHLNFGSGSQN